MMSKAKWFAVRKPSTGEIIATSANQIVPLKFCGPIKMYYIHQTPFSSCSVEGGSGDETTSKLVFFSFSGFSVGCCINREKVICYQPEFGKQLDHG